MSWWGKLVGGALGFALVGPIGALLGAALGHSLDKGIKNLEQIPSDSHFGKQEDVQAAFFTATFSIMGHIAKADGKVTESEINVARDIMQKMQLNEEQRKLAINLFTQGKQTDFDPESIILQFRSACGRRSNLLMMFMEIQLSTALADSELHQDEQKLLLNIAELLGFKRREFEQLLARTTAEKFYSRYQNNHTKPSDTKELLSTSYQLLGVNENLSQINESASS
jgi:DnaJ like chaperone protein